MSSLRPNKKRSVEATALVSSRLSYEGNNTGSASRTARTSATFFSQQQLEMLQAELEHERSLRLLDQKRAQQVQQRLEKQVELAVEEASESQTLLDTVQSQSESLTAQLRQARDDALGELRNLQLDMEETAEPTSDSSTERLWQEKARYLEEQVQTQAENEGALREEIEDLRAEMEEKLEEQDERNKAAQLDRKSSPVSVEGAPPAVLKELNRIRIQLAESERQQRQLNRSVEDLQRRNKTLIQEREEFRSASHRLPVVQKQLEDLSREHETVVAENASWTEFSKSLMELLKRHHGDIVLNAGGGPPDVSIITRILEKARSRVERAEERCNEAEVLAGKGSFNPDRTRVLHFQETPLGEALKEEIEVLKRQLESAKGEKAAKHSVAVDPDKLNQRLKENFKEQISLFREGVYLMTGFKVDMLPGCDRPTFRVRSVFAEQEEDQMLLKWPKGEGATSLDILNTDLAKVLATTPSYDYMTKLHSLPAFLASVQLSLFEKQTVLM
jgi:mitotic spindle assembly checkpoint protein MAD1